MAGRRRGALLDLADEVERTLARPIARRIREACGVTP